MIDTFEWKLQRKGELKLDNVSAEAFLFFIANQAKSDEVGPVGSQYMEELKAKSPDVGTLGLFACGKLVGALSYGAYPIRDNEKTIAARLDVVVTREECRHRGIGGLLTSHLYQTLLDKYPDTLVDISMIAAHPSVARHSESCGFTTPMVLSKTPRYSINVDTPESKQLLYTKAKKDIQDREGYLKLECLKCKSKNRGTPWCCPEEKEKKSQEVYSCTLLT